MVEVAPPSSMDQMLAPLLRGSFHVQLGVLWPLLPVGRHGARNLPLTPLYSNIATWLQAPGGEPASIEVAAIVSSTRVWPGFPCSPIRHPGSHSFKSQTLRSSRSHL